MSPKMYILGAHSYAQQLRGAALDKRTSFPLEPMSFSPPPGLLSGQAALLSAQAVDN